MHILEHVKAKIGTLPPFAARFAVSDLLFAADNSASIKLYFPNSFSAVLYYLIEEIDEDFTNVPSTNVIEGRINTEVNIKNII